MPTSVQESYNIIRMAMAVPPVPGNSVLSAPTVLNVFTNQGPAAWLASDIQFQFGFFASLGSPTTGGGIGANAVVLDLTNVASIQLDIKNPSSPTVFTSPSLFTALIPAASFTSPGNSLTIANWQTGSIPSNPYASNQQSIVVPMTNQQSNFAFQTTQTLVGILSAITTDSPAHQIIYGTFAIAFWPTGLGVSGAPPSNSPSYYTTAQSDARYPVVVQEVTNGTSPAALGANCPSSSPSAPQAWVQMTFSGAGGPFTLWVPGWAT